jgi:four helix bundle protein
VRETGVDVRQRRDLNERLLEYAVRATRLVDALPKTLVGRHVAGQLLWSATSVGANYEEAQGAESKEDFTHKLQVALKELRESNYWLRLISKSQMLPRDRLAQILDESSQLRAMLSKAVATAKGKGKASLGE